MKAVFLLFVALWNVTFGFLPSRSTRGATQKTQLADVSEKLIFDTKSNRFYEADLEKVCDEEFCLIDNDTGGFILLTKEEKERIFLDCIQSYYVNGKNSLPDDQFDKLKEDLSWEGSALVTLNRNETLFMNAMQAYNKGTPILKDVEFDDLKRSLKESGSKIAVDTEPKCYVDTGVCKVTWQPDKLKTSSLYVPASLASTIVYLGVFYELPFIRSLNPLIALAIGAVPLLSVSKTLTESFLFKDPFVASGACPKCGVENRILFGDVLGVAGDSEEATVKCTNCKTGMTIKRSTLRVSTLTGKGGAGGAAAASEAD